MYAISIQGRNFMGAAMINHKLDRLNLIVGGNMKGKTRISRAYQLAIGGFVPIKGGKSNSDILENLGNGNTTAVSTYFDGGQGVARLFSQGKKSVGQDVTVHGGLPADWKAPAVLFDLDGEYYALSGRDRTQFIVNALDLSKIDFDVRKLTAAIKNIKLAENTPESEAALEQIAQDTRVSYEASIRNEQGLSEWLEELIAGLEKKQSEANAAVKRMDGTVKGLIELKSQANAPEVPASLESELAAARTALSTAESAVTTAKNEKTTADNRYGRKVQLQSLLSKPDKTGEEITAKQNQIDELTRKTATYKSDSKAAQAEVTAIQKRVTEFTTQLVESGKAKLKLESNYKRVMASDKCPCCKGGGKWKGRYEKDYDKSIGDLVATITDGEKQLAEVDGKLKTAEKRLAAAQLADGQQSDDLGKISKLNGEIATLRQNAGAIEKTRGEFEALKDVQEPTALDQKIRDAETSRDLKKEKVKALEQEYNQLVAQRASISAQATAIEAGKKSIAELTVTKEVLKIVTEELQKITTEVIEPFLATANALAAPVLARPLVYRDGEIGYFNEQYGRFQSHSTFCGAEQALVYAALSIALASKSEVKVVFIDELAVIEPHRKLSLIALAGDLIDRGVIDQFIANDVTMRDYQSESGKRTLIMERWNIIEL